MLFRSGVRSALAANKVATKDYATQSVTVNPEYSYPQDGTAPVLTGYRATQSFEITVRAAPTAGAIVDGDSQARARALGLDPAAFLANNDSTGFFTKLGDLLEPGPTYTNVNDFRAIVIERP